MDLTIKRRSCEFDACRNGPCSSLEQAAEECRKAGFCIDWRNLTNGSCGMYTYMSYSIKQSQSNQGQINVFAHFSMCYGPDCDDDLVIHVNDKLLMVC